MPDLKLLRIEEGDNQKALVDKVNSNFSDILTFGGGPYGKIGDQGAQGDPGQTGPAGSYGDMGPRGSIWTIGATNPGTAGYINNDFWLNTSLGLGNPIYQFSSSGWNQYGFGILSQDIFRLYPNIQTSAGNSSYTGYTLTSVNPSNYTLVLSDSSLVGASASANPQYSKVIIAIDGGATGKNLMSFSKSNYVTDGSFNSKIPRFYWSSTATTSSLKYGLSWKMGDSLFFDIPTGELKFSTTSNGGSNSIYNSTGFNLNLSGSQPLSISSLGKIIFNFSTSGKMLLSNRNLKYLISTGGNRFEIPLTFDFTNTLNPSLPPLWLESTKANSGNLSYRALNVISSRASRLFLAYTSTEVIFDVKANGEVWYNKRINSIQPAQSLTATISANTNLGGPPIQVQWYTAIPGAIYSATGLTSQRINANNGSDFVISPGTYGPSTTIGICLWTPATGGSGTDNNGGWLNMLNDHEAISFSVRTDSDSKYIRFIGLNTSNTFSDAPYAPYAGSQAIDLTGTVYSGVSHVDFTIMNIAGTASTGGTSRWFKVYYSAYGGNLLGSKCGVLYTQSSTAF
jgi:hypothetical protein